MNPSLRSHLGMLAYRYRIYLIALVILAFTAAMLNIAVTYQVKELIDTIGANPHQSALSLLVLFVLYKAMFHGMHFIRRLFDIHYKPMLGAEIVTDMYTKTANHSLHWFDSHLSGEIANKITDFQDSIITILTTSYRALGNLATILIGVCFLFTINWIAASVLLTFIMTYTPIISLMIRKQLHIQQSYAQARQEAVGIINDSIVNIFGVKVIGNLCAEFALKLSPAIARWRDWDKKTRQYDAYRIDIADTVLITLMSIAQITALAYLYRTNQITAGAFSFIAMITLSIHKELDSLLDHLLFSINPKIAFLKTSYEFISMAADVVDAPQATLMPRAKGAITYDRVAFGYGKESTVFHDLTLRVKAGEKLGIVGTSGAGKTTLVKCLLRYFDTCGGRILIDDHDITQVTQASLRANISMIPQDITMFHRSILENLQLAKSDATQEEIEEACKKAKIHEDIQRMPGGYHAIVGERGVKVSGGQRQRIAIARAILKNAPILILDEATSALDTPTELLIQASINEMLKASNATTLVIAHRLSTLLHMDRIVVLEHGRILDEGTHTELIARPGLYQTLWNAQAHGFLPELV